MYRVVGIDSLSPRGHPADAPQPSVLDDHVHTCMKLPRKEIGAAYLRSTQDARSGLRRDMPDKELHTLIHTLKYHCLAFPSFFTTVDGVTERTTSKDLLALYKMGHGGDYSKFTIALIIVFTDYWCA